MAEPGGPPGRSWFDIDVHGMEHLEGPKRQIIFHGVNKSGSLTMVNALYQAYRHENRANQFFSTYRGIPNDLQQLRGLIEHSTGHAYFADHYLYGSYRRRPQHLLVTQFRNPLPRAMSCYQWLKDHHDVGGKSFTEWVVHTKGIAHSQVIQFSAGFGPDADAVRSAPGDQLLELAIKNIERDVAWFGIAEYFEESVYAMAALCGLQQISTWKRDNRSPDRSLVSTWSQEEIDVVREVFRWDFALYEWALDRFQQNLATLQFPAELARYKAECSGEYKDRLDPAGRPLEQGPDLRVAASASPPAQPEPQPQSQPGQSALWSRVRGIRR